MGLLRYTSPTGESRPWTLKELVQGKPLGHPSHPMFVHFPVAFYVGTLVLDILSKVGTFPWAPIAGTGLIIGAFVATVFAVGTGLVDRSTTKPGSKVRTMVNRHMWFQLATAVFFVVNLIVRYPDRAQAEADILWIALGAIGVITLVVGQYLGGILVYRIGFRVGER